MECSIKQQVSSSIMETCRWLRKISAISDDIQVLSLLFRAWVSFLINCSSLLLLFSRTFFTSFPQTFWEIFTAEAHRPGELSYLEHSVSLWSELGFLHLIIWTFRSFAEQPVFSLLVTPEPEAGRSLFDMDWLGKRGNFLLISTEAL